MTPPPLASPVSTSMRPTFFGELGLTLGAAATKMRENSGPALPILDDHRLVGVVTEKSLAGALANGFGELDHVDVAFTEELPVVKLYESGAEALRTMHKMGVGALVVVDDEQRVVGILRSSDLFNPPPVIVRPSLIGGMATPFGVYLTSGAVAAGAGGLALVATGAMLFSILASATILSVYVHNWLMELGGSFLVVNALTSILQIAMFAATFRLLPISKIHAAEHMVVHAIERGEPLVPSVIARMPRVHPRCGTNLAVGASLFLGIATSSIPNDELRLLLALLATLLLWRRLGGLVQYWVTTSPPKQRHLEMAIRSGKELLDRQVILRKTYPGLLTRLWNSGMFHVMAGSMIVLGLLAGISAVFGWTLPL